MSSINNDVTLSISRTTTNTTADNSSGEQLIAPQYKALKELTQADYETLLHQAFAEARKTIRESELADPKTMIAMLAVYGVQEVHSLGFKPPSAIRAMGLKACATEGRSTKGCLLQAKRELITAARERAAAAVAGMDEMEEGEDV